MKGTLYMCAGPIGNLEDMTYRAIRILKDEVEVIFCEDTRQSGKLLKHYGISKKTYSLHSHSSDKSLEFAMKFLNEGKSIAYLTDCGTPGVSDPGSKLAARAHENQIQVSPIPGASALTSLVSVAGFSGKNIIFGGFVSKKEGRKKNELLKLKEFSGTIVIYESPHRILKTLNTLAEVFPENNIVIGRELTKLHEEVISGTSLKIVENIENLTVKGEFAIAISNP